MIKESTTAKSSPQREVVISVCDVSKTYQLYPSHQDRLKEAFHPFRKSYHKEFLALKKTSFDIYRGECVGILGRNGAGKSTLLQLITGVVSPSVGSISIAGKIAALLELGAGFNPDLTGRENVILSSEILNIPEVELSERVSAVEGFADIGSFFDQPMKIYSSGMYARVAFANAIHVNPTVLIVDEILGVGDAKFQEKCYRKMEELRLQGVSILFVSHSVSTVLDVCDRCILLEKGEIIFFGKTVDAVNLYYSLLYGNHQQDITPFQVIDTLPEPTHQYPENSRHMTEIKENRQPNIEQILDWMVHDTTLVNRIDTRLSFNNDHFRIGNKKAQLIDYIVISGTDIDARIIPSGNIVDIYLKVLFHNDVLNPIVGIGIVKIDGIGVYGTNTSLMQINLKPRRAQEFSVYHFKFINNLVGGDYFLNFGIEEIDGGEKVFLDNLRSIAHLIFEATPSVTGIANMGCTFQEIC